MEPTPAIVRTCSNCGSTLVGKFCASCGQQDRPLDVSLPELAREVYADVVELDGRFFASLRKLFFVPGFLTLEYFSGRRAAWLPPIRLYLIISVLYFAISALSGNLDSNVDVTVTGTSDQDTSDTLQNMGFESEAELEAAINAAEALWMPRVMFILMPILGVLVQMGQRKSGRRYPQHFVFAVHLQTAWFGLFALLEIVAHFTGSELAGQILVGGGFLVAAVYMVLALQRAYHASARHAVVHTLLAGLAYWFFAILLVSLIVLPIFL
jgi:hypothetical protein